MNYSSNSSVQRITESTVEGLFRQLLSMPVSEKVHSTYYADPANERITRREIVTEIDNEIDTYAVILKSVHGRISACRTRRNRHASINTLPQDIMLLIFKEVLDGLSTSSNYYQRLFHLRFICKAWDSFIQNYFPFWLPTFADQSSSLHDITIPRSQNHPLHIRSTGSFRGGYRGRGTSRRSHHDRFMTRLITEGWAIGSFTYQTGLAQEQDAPIVRILSSPAPYMEFLDISLNASLRVETLLNGVAPRLKEATVDRLTLGPDLSALTGLRRLTLGAVNGLTLRRFMDLLSQSPQLHELRLTLTPLAEPHDCPTLSISLPNLRQLTIHYLPTLQTCAILSNTRFPATVKLEIRAVDPTPEVSSFLKLVEAVMHHYPATNAIRLNFDPREALRLDADEDRWSLSTDLSRLNVDLQDIHGHWKEYLAQEIPPPASALVTSFRTFYLPQANALITVLDDLYPNLQCLTMGFDIPSDSQEEFNLSSLVENGKAGGWRCPNLRDISLQADDFRLPIFRAVDEIAQRRADAVGNGLVKTPLRSCRFGVGWGSISDEGNAIMENLRKVIDVVDDGQGSSQVDWAAPPSSPWAGGDWN